MEFLKTLLVPENGIVIGVSLFLWGLIFNLSPYLWKVMAERITTARQAMLEEAKAQGKNDVVAVLEAKAERMEQNKVKMLKCGKFLMAIGGAIALTIYFFGVEMCYTKPPIAVTVRT